MPSEVFQGAGGYDEWGVQKRRSWKEGGDQYRSPVGVIGEAVRRFAGQPLPGGAGQLRDALIFGQLDLEDETGRVSLDRSGSMRLEPKGSIWNMQIAPGSASVGFDTRQARDEGVGASDPFEVAGPADPMASKSPAKQELERMLATYQGANPDWYRP